MKIVIDNLTIYADGYIPNLEEKSIQFFKEKSDLDDIPPLRVDGEMLSDFGKEILCVASRKYWIFR